MGGRATSRGTLRSDRAASGGTISHIPRWYETAVVVEVPALKSGWIAEVSKLTHAVIMAE